MTYLIIGVVGVLLLIAFCFVAGIEDFKHGNGVMGGCLVLIGSLLIAIPLAVGLLYCLARGLDEVLK